MPKPIELSTSTQRVTVPKQCPIIIGTTLWAPLERWVRTTFPAARAAYLVDGNVLRLHRSAIKKLRKDKKEKIYVCPAGERHKNLATLENIAGKLMHDGYGRDTVLVNIGGGMACDLGAFLASTFMRGIPFVQVPTTLLAMVDASVGGKTAVDLRHYKNALGTFCSAAAIYMDLDFLQTLPQREYVAGLGECIKHGLIGDLSLWRMIEQNKYRNSPNFLARNVRLKAKIVAIDPTEKNMRAILNVGHTIGHALETYFLGTKQELLHGEAVALGMLAELAILEKINRLASRWRHSVARLCHAVGLPSRLSIKVDPDGLWRIAAKDKKNRGGQIRISNLQYAGRLSPKQTQWTLSISREDFQYGLATILQKTSNH